MSKRWRDGGGKSSRSEVRKRVQDKREWGKKSGESGETVGERQRRRDEEKRAVWRTRDVRESGQGVGGKG